MANEFAQCKANIEGVLGREMTPEENRAIKNRAPEILRKINNTNRTPGEIAHILQLAKDDADAKRAFNTRATAIAYRAKAELKDGFWKGLDEIKHAGEVWKSKMKGSLWNFRGANDSLANLMDKEMYARQMAFYTDLKKSGLYDIAYSHEIDDKIIEAEDQIRNGQTPDPRLGQNAIKLAQIYEKHTEGGRLDMNANGAWIPKNDHRLFALRYDHNKIAGSGDNKWGSKEAQLDYVNEYMKRMDWSKAFGGNFARATDAMRRERLGKIWNQFKADTHFKSDGQFYGPGKVYGIQPHIEMVLKSAADRYAIWQKYGRGSSLAEAHMMDMANIGRQLGVMKILGVRAEKTLSETFRELHSELLEKGNTFEEKQYYAEQAAKLEEAFNDEMHNTWRLITDTVAHPNDNGIGRFASATRMTLNTAAVAFSLPTLLTDLNIRAVRVNTQGRGSWLGNLADNARLQFTPKGFTEAERAEFYAQSGVSLEINGRPTDLSISEHRVYDSVAKANAFVRSLGGHSMYDNSARLSSQIRDYMHYHAIKGKTWGDLNPGEQKTLNSFGIDRIGWDVMRKAGSRDIPNGWGKGMTPDEIRAMPLDEFKPLTNFQNPSAVTLKRMRERLADQYRNLIGENANRSVSAPSTARNARLRMGSRFYDPNSVHGWAMSQALALKGWAINYMTEHLGRAIVAQYSEHVSTGQIMKDLMTGRNMPGLKTVAQYMVGNIALMYVANSLRQAIAGKAPVNPLGVNPGKPVYEQPWFDALSEATARGAAGIYGDFLLGQSGVLQEAFDARSSSSLVADKITEIAMGPESEFYAKATSLLIKSSADAIKSGGVNTKALQRDEQQLFGVGYHALPPSNMLATKWALDYYFFNALSEQINPGYQNRLKEYAKRQNTYYLAGQPGLK